MPHLPPEIVLIILSTDDIDFTTLLRSTRVNKEWHRLIHHTNALRTKLFLPHHTPSGKRVAVGDDRHTPWVPATMVLDYIPRVRKHSRTPTILLSDLEFELHPLLLPHKVEEQPTSPAF